MYYKLVDFEEQMIRTSPLPTEKSLFAAFSSQVSTPEAIFSSKMANSATQIAGNTVDMYNKLPGQILKWGTSR